MARQKRHIYPMDRRPLTLKDLRRAAAKGLIECKVGPVPMSGPLISLGKMKLSEIVRIEFSPYTHEILPKGTPCYGALDRLVIDYEAYVHIHKLKGVEGWIVRSAYFNEWCVDPARMLDRLIQLFGPNAKVADIGRDDLREYRERVMKAREKTEESRKIQEMWERIERQYAPKDTDEVAPSSELDGNLHGGNNASQEVPDGQAEGGNNVNNTASFDAFDETRASDKALKRRARGVTLDTGSFLSPEYIKQVRKDLQRDPLVKEAYKRIREFVELVRTPAGRVASPRVDAKRLVREMTGKSYRASRWRREELDRNGNIIIAIDWSGSCADYASDMMAMGIELSVRYDNVIVVGHTNGLLQARDGMVHVTKEGRRLEINGVPLAKDSFMNPIDAPRYVLWEPWKHLLRFFETDVILWIGDNDGLEIRETIKKESPRTRIVFLDSSCEYGAEPYLREKSTQADVWVDAVAGLRTLLPGLNLARAAWKKL